MRVSLSNRTCRGCAVLAACAAAATLPFLPLGCSSSSSAPAPASDAASDVTSDDSTTADVTEPSEAGPDASPDSTSADAGPDASDAGTTDEADSGSDAPLATCTPFDASIDGAAIEAGLALVSARNCMQCHRNDFSGGVEILGAYSKNLTPDPATGLGCWSDDDIATAILYGMGPGGEFLCVMPRWSTYPGLELDAATAEQVVQYLRTLPPVSHVVPETDCGGLGLGPDAGDGGDAQDQDASMEAAADGGPG